MPLHDLPALAILLIFAAAGLSILIVQARTGVPPMSSSAAEGREVAALLRQANLPDDAVIYDLGAGWGSLVIALAHAFPNAQIRGVELSPLPYWISRLRTRGLPNLSLSQGDFFNTDLSDAQAVTCYLMIKAMPKLADLLDRTLTPGTSVVLLSFWFRERQAAATSMGAGLLGATALYYWPAKSAATHG